MPFKYKYVFLLGRPGSGKSAIYKLVADKLIKSKLIKSCEKLDDFPKLWATLQFDDDQEKKGKKRLYSKRTAGGYVFTDDSVWDEFLKELKEDIKKINKKNHLIFIEFSRDNYLQALRNFEKEILRNSLIVYIDTDFETCWRRNLERHKKAIAAGFDDHLVPREQMERKYRKDDGYELATRKDYKTLIIKNDKPGEKYLEKIATRIVKTMGLW